MHFQLSFIKKDKDGYPFYVPSHEIGTTGVARIREELGCLVPLNRIKSNVNFFSSHGHIVVPEDIAFESKRFGFTNNVQVVVPDNMMNQFIGERVCSQKDPETGEVIAAWLEHYIREDAVLAAWAFAGYPNEWSIESFDL